MGLTADQFSEILEGLERKKHGDPGNDKRRAPRVEQRASVVLTLRAEGGDRSHSVTVRNFSARGIGLLLSEKLAKGDQFVVKLERQDGPGVAILCAVAHCRQIHATLFAIGAEFTCLLNQGDARKDPRGEQERISASILD